MLSFHMQMTMMRIMHLIGRVARSAAADRLLPLKAKSERLAARV